MSEYSTMKSRTLSITHDIPISKTKIYWEGLKEGKVYATKCNNCGDVYYPPQTDCPRCLTSDVGWIQLSEGKLETFTQVQLKPQGFTQYEQNYIIAIVRVAQGVKVIGWLENVDIKDIKVGVPIEITAKITPDDFPVIVFKIKNNK
jgi:uncharacterized OB-fold protein